MKIEQNYNLSKLNTFGINVNTKFFVEIKSEEDLLKLFSLPEFKDNKKMFLGGGSNVLFTKDFDGIVVLNKLAGIEIIEEDLDSGTVKAMGGELWHDLVLFAVNCGYWGLENLAFVPGTVGASPIQNIGAYGVELKDSLFQVEAFEIETGLKKIFSKKECNFGYRDSIFKNEFKGKYFISAVIFKLNKKENKNIKYKTIKEYIEKNNIKISTPKEISEIVGIIRNGKLPDPKILGNAGSFFKNIFIDKIKLQKLLTDYSDVPYFEEEDIIKIPAGWLIEQCGWKGKRFGNVGVFEKQALVLVNYGGATGLEITSLANKIIKSVKDKFDLDLTPEVNLF